MMNCGNDRVSSSSDYGKNVEILPKNNVENCMKKRILFFIHAQNRNTMGLVSRDHGLSQHQGLNRALECSW